MFGSLHLDYRSVGLGDRNERIYSEEGEHECVDGGCHAASLTFQHVQVRLSTRAGGLRLS